jgi:acyl-coenzyme A thioesterase THEM4
MSKFSAKYGQVEFRTPPRDVLEVLQSIPWCSRILADPTSRPYVQQNRIPKSSSEDALIAKTLATNETVRIMQPFFRAPSPAFPSGEHLFIVSLASGVSGFEDSLHGGMIMLLMDETLGHAAIYSSEQDKKSYTASVTVDFKRPVPTPSIVLFRSWADKRDGRKMWAHGTLENGEGIVYAIGKTLWIEAREGLKL